jgi:hypothetical protein
MQEIRIFDDANLSQVERVCYRITKKSYYDKDDAQELHAALIEAGSISLTTTYQQFIANKPLQSALVRYFGTGNINYCFRSTTSHFIFQDCVVIKVLGTIDMEYAEKSAIGICTGM